VLDDTLDVRIHAESQHPVLPLLLFGHSMGGLIAMNSALRDPDGIDALAVWNANFSAGLMGRAGQAILAVERMLLGSDVPSAILPKLTFQDWAKKETSGRTDFDWLSRDPAEVDKYVADPLCGWDASVGMWQDVFKLIFAGADDRNFSKLSKNLPVHLRGGGHDPATDFAKATKTLATRCPAWVLPTSPQTSARTTATNASMILNRQEVDRQICRMVEPTRCGDRSASLC
jgi:alpha-beta hydrolase superfamily lysophospholipase